MHCLKLLLLLLHFQVASETIANIRTVASLGLENYFFSRYESFLNAPLKYVLIHLIAIDINVFPTYIPIFIHIDNLLSLIFILSIYIILLFNIDLCYF